VSTGRSPDGAGQFYPLASRTPGAANSSVRTSAVVINELMYKPISGLDDDQYVELYNQGGSAVDLSGWRFTKGVDLTFPPSASLAAGGYLVVARNPARLLANYPSLSSANIFGPFNGSLAGSGERVALARPDFLVTTNLSGQVKTNTNHVVQD